MIPYKGLVYFLLEAYKTERFDRTQSFIAMAPDTTIDMPHRLVPTAVDGGYFFGMPIRVVENILPSTVAVYEMREVRRAYDKKRVERLVAVKNFKHAA